MVSTVSFIVWSLSIITLKSFTSSFTLPLLYLYLSKIDYVSFDVVRGVLIWAFCYSINACLLVHVFGGCEKMKILTLKDLADPSRLLFEYCRFIAFFVPLGLLTDLAFSPLHRFVHNSPRIYKSLHQRHHSFKKNLKSPVIYHAESFDDVLIAACPIVGFFATMLLFGAIGAWLPASLWAGEGVVDNGIWCNTAPERPARVRNNAFSILDVPFALIRRSLFHRISRIFSSFSELM